MIAGTWLCCRSFGSAPRLLELQDTNRKLREDPSERLPLIEAPAHLEKGGGGGLVNRFLRDRKENRDGPAASVLPLNHHFYLFGDMTLFIKNTQLWSGRISINKKKIFYFDLF